MNKAHRSSLAKTIMRCFGLYLLALLLFEACYWHTMGRFAKGFILGTFEFFWAFLYEEPGVCVWRLVMMIYLAILEVFGLKIGSKICSFLKLRGVLALMVCVISVIAATMLIHPLMELVKYVLTVVGLVVSVVCFTLTFLFGIYGALLILIGLTKDGLDGEERFALVALGVMWKRIRWEDDD